MAKNVTIKFIVKLADKALDKLKSGLGKTVNFAKAAITGIAQVGAVVGGVGAFFVKAASDAEESNSKFDAVFKHLGSAADTWARSFSVAVSRNSTEVKGWMATLQDTFVPLGFTRDKALELSKGMTKLTVDLASFNNKAEPDVLKDLQSAMVGNHETVRKYGVILTESTVKQEAVRLGLAASTKEVTEASKVQARYSLIMKGTGDAQGDAERTAKSFANRMKSLQSAVKDARIEVGQQIIENGNLGDILDAVTSKLRSLSEDGYITLWLENLSTGVRGLVTLVEGVIDTFSKLTSKVASLNEVSAFWGGFVGGQGGIKSRTQSGANMMNSVDAREAAELAKIRAARDARRLKKAEDSAAALKKVEEEKAAVVVSSSEVATEAADDQAASAQTTLDTTEEKAEVESEAVTVRKVGDGEAEAAAARLLALAQETNEVEKERVEIRRKDPTAAASSSGSTPRPLTGVGGQAITADDVSKHSQLTIRRAAEAEAHRIKTIIEAIKEASGGSESSRSVDLLQQIATSTAGINEKIIDAVSMN